MQYKKIIERRMNKNWRFGNYEITHIITQFAELGLSAVFQTELESY